MKFHDKKIEFDVYEETTARKFEAAVKEITGMEDGDPEERLPDRIQRQCTAIFRFFDQLFGDGFHKELFGETVSLTVCVDTYMDFMEEVNKQRLSMESKAAEMLSAAETESRKRPPQRTTANHKQ